MKILALVSNTTTLNAIHANRDFIVCGINHASVERMSVSAFMFSASAVSALIVTADLEMNDSLSKTTEKQ